MGQSERDWDVFKQAVVSALRESSAMARRVLRDAGARIAQRHDGAPATAGTALNQKALRFLDQQHDQWVRLYPAFLLEAFAEVVEFDPYQQDEGIVSGLGDVGFSDELSIQGKSEFLHINRTLESAVEHALDQLDGLISAARGCPYIRRSRNPMRPDNYLLAAQKMLFQAKGESEQVQLLMLKGFAQALAPALTRTYALLTNQLSEAGVAAVQKRQTGFGALTSGFGNMALLTGEAENACDRVLPRQEILVALGDESTFYVLPDRVAIHDEPGHQHAAIAGQSASASLAHQQSIAPAGGKVAAPASEPLSTAEQAPPAEHAAVTLQGLLVEVVKDVNHLPAVKELVAHLQPPLRALVQTDPAFLRDGNHPARQLLEYIRAQARGFPKDEGAGTPRAQGFVAQLQAVLQTHRVPKATSGEPFALALAALRAATSGVGATQPPAAAQAPNPAGGSAQAAEAPPVDGHAPSQPAVAVATVIDPDTVLAKLTAQIKQQPMYATAHPRVQKFVTGPWAKVIVKSMFRHAKDSSEAFSTPQALIDRDPKGYLRLCTLMLTSVQASYLQDPDAEVLRAIKSMHDHVREGLLSVGLESAKVDSAVGKLKDLHRQALQEATAELAHAGGAKLLYGSPQGGPIDIGQAFLPNSAAQEGEAPVRNRRLQLPRLTTEQGGVAIAAPVTAAGTTDGDQLPELRIGEWYSLGEGESLRTQLSWTSPDKSIFMFTSEDGLSQTMTRRRLVQLHAAEQLKRLS